jgi:hypothetical protein
MKCACAKCSLGQIIWVRLEKNVASFTELTSREYIVTQVWTVSMPIVILNSPAVSDKRIGGDNPKFGTGRDITGIVIWALGILIEATADQQKVEFQILRGLYTLLTSSTRVVYLQIAQDDSEGKTCQCEWLKVLRCGGIDADLD